MTIDRQSRGVRHKACPKCGGDAILDLLDSEWRCLQCGKSLMSYSPMPSGLPSDWSTMVRTILEAAAKRDEAKLVSGD
jgi:ribosomal protein L37AE/L43A